jgi:orotidine-5'-phosphate decarboxylase
MADHHARLAVEARQAANDGMVVRVTAVTMQFLEVGENQVDVVQGIGPLRMPRDQGALPRRELGVDLFGQALVFGIETGNFLGNLD